VSAPVRNAVQTVFDSCQNLVVIVNEFLDISRIEQGRMKYDMIDFDLASLAEEVLKELKPTIEQASLSYGFTRVGEGHIVHADEGKMKQVIGNIIDNAIKYTPTGSIDVTVSHIGDRVICEVKDTGIGLDKEDISKLFNKFARAKDANKTNVIGTGLGLYLAKQMVEAQGGTVDLRSPGKGLGSTFVVDLPYAQQ
jgi:signal transduction histidine kinase